MQAVDIKKLARNISLVENESAGYEQVLADLRPEKDTPIIGITGPPGAGKSTLINALITELTSRNKKIAIVAIDPTSPFNLGSLLGDRIRMAEHYTNPNVFIRSLATRGSLGGLSAKAIEVTEVLKGADFDYIIVETVGVGQSEVEIAGLADCTLVVFVPESGDEIQSMKSGIMEIGDVFVVNKFDRPGAKEFMGNLKKLIAERNIKVAGGEMPVVIGTVAMKGEGITELIDAIDDYLQHPHTAKRKSLLLADKVWQLLIAEKMKGIDKSKLAAQIEEQLDKGDFHLYQFMKGM